jgi:hypothetical protein
MFRFSIRTLFRLTVFVATYVLYVRESWYGTPLSRRVAFAILAGLALWFAYKAGAKKPIVAETREPEKWAD